MSTKRSTGRTRCGVTGPDATGAPNALGCCRELGHAGDHDAHPADTLTGTAGRLVASRGPFRVFTTCDGRANPAADRIVASRRPGAIETRTELIPPDEEVLPDEEGAPS